jgi:phosphoglycerate dehydrogenase-like enzyme
MEPVNVLVNDQITEDVIPRIEAVDPRIKVTHIGKLLSAELDGDAEATKVLDALLAETEVYAGMRIPARLLARAPRLKWVQVAQAGVDKVLLDEEFRNSPLMLTNVAGVHSFAIAEFAIQSCLAYTKGTVECARQKENRLWQPFHPAVLPRQDNGIGGFRQHRKTYRTGRKGLRDVGHRDAQVGNTSRQGALGRPRAAGGPTRPPAAGERLRRAHHAPHG